MSLRALECHCIAVALRFPFTETSPNHEKQPQTTMPPPPDVTIEFWQVVSSWHPPNLDFTVRKVASYDGATLKVTELFSKDILLPMLVYGDCMAVCSISYTCQKGVLLK